MPLRKTKIFGLNSLWIIQIILAALTILPVSCTTSGKQAIDSKDPIIGIWIDSEKTEVEFKQDGSCQMRFDKDFFVNLNHTEVGMIRPFIWEKEADGTYRMYQPNTGFLERLIQDDPSPVYIKNGKLIFDEGDYTVSYDRKK